MNKKKLSAMRLRAGRAWLCTIVLAFALMPDVGRAQHAHPSVQNAGPTVGMPGIPFELRTLDGKAISLESFRGKPLVMNFFASWCEPCREEMPIINDLAAKAASNDYSVLAVAVEDSRSAVTQYAKESKLAFPIALDLNSTVKRAYRIFGPPATFFIDRQGIIRDIIIGPLTPERASTALSNAGIRR
jgi:cytochrome c biogenesis protein CcmG, thiol:disulfide interchange protein DsbE